MEVSHFAKLRRQRFMKLIGIPLLVIACFGVSTRGCSQITDKEFRAKFLEIRDGMSMADVSVILGEPAYRTEMAPDGVNDVWFLRDSKGKWRYDIFYRGKNKGKGRSSNWALADAGPKLVYEKTRRRLDSE